jgi:PST family polysaccharide transporter
MTSSHGQILRASAIIGLASIVGILLGIVRMRIAASAVGPVGIGIIGLMQNFVTLAAAIAAMGIGSGGARQIAAAWGRADEREAADIKRTLWIGGMALALAGGAIAWLVAAFWSAELISSGALAKDALLLGAAAALTVLGVVQTGIFTGTRRLGDIARVNIAAGLLATVVVALAFPLWPGKAIIVFVLASPLLSAIVGQYYLGRRDPLPAGGTFSPAQLRIMLAIGAGMTTSLLLALASGLLVRGLVHERLGPAELGYFQASWAVASMYLGIVLNAMATDYFPRLSEAANDDATLVRLVNEQVEVLILVGGPIIIGMIGAAPLVMVLLYGPDFTQAAGLFRIQLLGDVVKLLGWPLGFLLLAKAASGRFVLVELMTVATFVGVTWLLLASVGLDAAGWGQAAMFAAGLALTMIAVAGILPGFRWQRHVLGDAALLLAAAILLWLLAPDDVMGGAVTGAGAALLMGWRSYRRLARHFPGLLASLRGWLPSRPR